MSTTTRSQLSLWQQLVKVALEQPTSAFPSTVLSKACDRVIDTVASALASASVGEGLMASRVVQTEGSAGPASIWASKGKTASAALACLANGTLAHAVEYDDTHALSTLHPGVVIVPAALAVGQEVNASGPDVLAAVTIGYEIASRLAALVPGKFQRQGFQPTAVLGIFGATAAVCRLKRVSLQSATHAGGIAGSLTGGLMEYLADGSDVKQLHAGWVAQGAVRAVQFAEGGLTGPRTVLEGEKGVFQAFISQSIDPLAAVAGYGDDWRGVDAATKLYPACYGVHAVIDAWHLVRAQHGLGREDLPNIKRITGLVPEFFRQLVCEPLAHKRAPRTVYEARFSLPYVLARAIVDGHVDLHSFLPERVADPALAPVMQKIDYETADFRTFPGEFPGGVRVEMSDGRVFEATVEYNPGGPSMPASGAQLEQKLLAVSERFSDSGAGRALIESMRMLCQPGSVLHGFSSSMARIGAAEHDLNSAST
ncbi:MmgE/PrpD family protein [Ottowia sp.]|uniref:MmgE/PrpD family protein n=1 Tax=Ottowia sp. TaxID=1898956 RepID=UPI0025F47FB2|nr:MmgE/PrpD family protein [Ottowia sp.]